jgi:hypothetical protein
MSKEFICLMSVCIFILLVNIAILILLIIQMRKSSANRTNPRRMGRGKPVTDNEQIGVIFCRVCGGQFDSNLGACPVCKPPRK